MGFGYKYDEAEKQYAHSAAMYVLTPEGKISRYLYGIEFQNKDLRLALLEASNGKIGTVVDRILLFCYRYDPKTRKYSVYLTKLMQAGCGSTVLFFGGYLAIFWRRQRKGSLIQMINEAFAGTIPLQGSEIAARWDNLYNFLIGISIFFFVLVVGAMLAYMKLYRHTPNRKTKYLTGSHSLEAIFVVIPTVLLLIIFGWGYSIYRTMAQAPSDAYEIRVLGKQWLWTFQYDNGGRPLAKFMFQ